MPHWGKKFRNGTKSKKRTLTYRGAEMKLEMLGRELWESFFGGKYPPGQRSLIYHCFYNCGLKE